MAVLGRKSRTLVQEMMSLFLHDRLAVRRRLAASAVGLAQHSNERRPERPIVHAVDQQLGEDAAFRIAPELTILSARSKSGSIRT